MESTSIRFPSPRAALEILLAVAAGVVLLGPIGDLVWVELGHPPALNTPRANALWLVARMAFGVLAWAFLRGLLPKASSLGARRRSTITLTGLAVLVLGSVAASLALSGMH